MLLRDERLMTDSTERTQPTPIQKEDQSVAIKALSKALQEALERIEALEATVLGGLGWIAKKRPTVED